MAVVEVDFSMSDVGVIWWGGALFGGCKRDITASVDASTTEIWAPYSPRTLIEASFDRGLGD